MSPDNLKIQSLTEEEIEKLKESGGGYSSLPPKNNREAFDLMQKIAKLIKEGAITFLIKEYIYLSVFIVCFGVLLAFTVEPKNAGFPLTTLAFLIGALTSILAGYIGMRIAVHANVRTTLSCCSSVYEGFKVAFRGG